MMFVELVSQILLVFLTIMIHELLHYSVAYLLGYKPKVEFENFLTPCVVFRNKNRDMDNLLIALAAPAGLFMVGLFIPANLSFLSFVRIICFFNILYIFPWCTDGQVILLSLLNLLKRGGKP